MKDKENNISIKELLEICALTNAVARIKNSQNISFKDLEIALDDNWSLYHASHWALGEIKPIGLNEDYRGVVVVNQALGVIVLAHRGLQLSSLKNVASGLIIGTKRCPDIAKHAMKFCDIALKLAQEKDYQLIHTGFSMGGFLAQMTGAYANHNHKNHGRVTCFDAPGATLAIESCQFDDNRQRTINYVTAPNLVNTVNCPYGFVRQVTEFRGHNFYKKSKLKPLLVDRKLRLDFENLSAEDKELFEEVFILTLHYHRQEVLRDSLNNEGQFAYNQVEGWPVALIEVVETERKAIPEEISCDTSYGVVTDSLLKHAKETSTVAGLEDYSGVTYQLEHVEVIYNEVDQDEYLCKASRECEQKNAQEQIIDNDKNPEEKYPLSCLLM